MNDIAPQPSEQPSGQSVGQSLLPACEQWIGPPHPELWRKVEGYEDGTYSWAVATDDKIRWFASETTARHYFKREVERRA